MFNILELKDFKINKTRIALPKNEQKSQYGNLIILNTKDINGSKAIISNPFINKLSIYNQIYKDGKFIFKVRGKSVNKREIKERLADYTNYKESLDLKGVVVFNANKGKNMYYDISRYNQLFFEATTKESHTVKYIDYIDILKSHILDQEFMKDYPTKVMIIDVESWVVPKVDSNKEAAYDNPLNLIYFAMKKDIEKFKELGDIEIVVSSSKALFKFNPVRCDDKSFADFKREVYKIEKSVIPEDDLETKTLNAIDSGSVEPLSTDPKIANAVKTASDNPKIDGEPEANKVVATANDPNVIDAIKDKVLEPVNIKSTAMSKRDEELREAQKKVRINSTGNSLEELMEIKAANVEIPVNDVGNKVMTLNKNMTKVKFINFAHAYNEQLYEKDISSIAYSMKDKSIPVFIRDVKKENTSDSLNAKETWTFSLEDEARRRHTLKFDVPIFMDGRYMLLNGNKKEFNNQRFLKPLVKTGPDTVQVCTNYNKIFMTRYGENVESKYEKFKQMVITDKKRFSFVRGNCSRVNSAYKTTIEYDTLAKTFAEITVKDEKGKSVWILHFNQDKLKEICMKEPALKQLYDYDVKNNQLVIGYHADKKELVCIDCDSQNIIDGGGVTKTKSVKEAGVNLYLVNRLKEIENEISLLSGQLNEKKGRTGDKSIKERIDLLETEKDRLIAAMNDNKAPVVSIDDVMKQREEGAIESFIPVTEDVDGSMETDDTYEDGGIVNYILARMFNTDDIKDFAQYKSGKRFMYTRCKVMKKNIPLIVFLSYCEGLSTVLRKAEIRYMFSDKRPRLEGYDLINKGIVQFADGFLIYDKYPLEKSLLMNGLSAIDTKNNEFAEFDDKSIYLDVFDTLFGSRMLSNALDNFYEWMIDLPTEEILRDLNYPTDFVGLLLAGNKLLADNNYKDEIDMSNWRIRNNELVYAYAYKRIADAYTKYRMTSENKNPVKISIPRDAVIKDIMMSMIVEDVSELSPIVDVEKSHAVTDKGPSGTNLEQAYTQDRRSFHPTMKGVMAISTSPDANVGLVRELTLEPNITNARGYVKPQSESALEDVNLFSAAELVTPLGVTRDDCVRTAMASKQSKHIIPVENASPVLMSNGADRVLPYHISNDFTVVAKDDGTVVERDEKNKIVIVEYKNLKGKDAVQVIDMSTKVVKNGAGGFWLTNQLNCDKLKKGYKFKKNDILAHNTRFFSNSGHYGIRFNIGTLVKVACMSSYANFEDGDCVTKKLSKKMGTEICMTVEAVIGANSNVESIVKVGQEVHVGDPLIVYDQSSEDASFNKLLANIGADLKEEITGMGKTPVKAKYSGVIQDIKMYSTVDLDEMSPSLKKIVSGYYAVIKAKKNVIAKYRKGDSLNDYTFTEQDKKIETEDGKIMGTTVGEGVKIVFFIKYQDNLDVGDKLVHFGPLKCINGEMIPEGQEPFTIGEPDEEISTTFAPGGVLARMVPSVMQTMFGNKVIIGLKKEWLKMYMKDNPNFKPKDELY